MQARIRHIDKKRRFIFIEPTNGPKEKIYAHAKGCRTPFEVLEVGHIVNYKMGLFKKRSVALDIDCLPDVILTETEVEKVSP